MRDDFEPPRRSPLAMFFAIGLGGAASLLVVWLLFGSGVVTRKGGVPDWIPKAPPPTPLAQVQVTSSPKGAKVYLEQGSVALATTPGVITVTPKPHTLRFELPGMKIQKIDIDAGQTTQANASWDAVTISIDGRPEGEVALLLDGKPLGFTPFSLYYLKENTPHEVKARYQGEERVFVFQPTQDLERMFDFTVPASAPASVPASAPGLAPPSEEK
jgi:PEGA domain